MSISKTFLPVVITLSPSFPLIRDVTAALAEIEVFVFLSVSAAQLAPYAKEVATAKEMTVELNAVLASTKSVSASQGSVAAASGSVQSVETI